MRQREKSPCKSLEDFMDPNCFKLITESSKVIAAFDPCKNLYGIASLALKLRHTLNKCVNIVIAKGIEARGKDLQ